MGKILTGIVIMVVGTVVLWLGNCIKGIITTKIKEKRIYSWLKKNTQNKAGEQFKTTNEISQALGIGEDIIRKACTSSRKINQRFDKKDSWGIFGKMATSIYEDRGLIEI